ncbi:MFS transporter [Amycolatopsis sp. A1MSW2902]|uniref:MFS transporter n=1 Tax=Amycolatopsis sp. A1MSW2902 TaxID=687413 RepID=UPI00307CE422
MPIAIYAAVFLAMLDVSVVVLALPSIQTDLDGSTSLGQWVIAAYTVCLSVLSLSVGAVSDRYGRKRLFLIGVAIFTVGSVSCALAWSPAVLIAARLVQGVGAAIVVPGSLSLVARSFTEPSKRARAIAGWSTTAASAALAGPIIGGLLVNALGWRSVFWINLPIGIVALALGWRFLHESADPEHTDIDPVGQLLGICVLGTLSYGLINAGEHGWNAPITWIPLTLSAVALPVFVAVEARQLRPMLPVRLFTDRRFTIPILGAFTVGFSLLALGVFIPAYLQQGQHHSAAVAGLIMVPPALVAVITPFLTGRILAKTGPVTPITGGLAAAATGALLLLTVNADGPPWVVIVAMSVLNLGYSFAVPATSAAVLDAVHDSRAGTASATASAVRQTGTTLGIAVLGTILAARLAAPASGEVDAAQTSGLHGMAITAAGVALITALVCAVGLRTSRLRAPNPEGARNVPTIERTDPDAFTPSATAVTRRPSGRLLWLLIIITTLALTIVASIMIGA